MWIVKLKNGEKITQEKGVPFLDIKNDVSKLGYRYYGTTTWLPENMRNYRFGGTASCAIGQNAEVESYWISCEMPNGNAIKIRFYNNKRGIQLEN